MLRNRFVLGFSVLFLAAGIYVATQGRGTAPKSTQTATAPKAPAAAPKTKTKTTPVKPAKTTPPTKTQHPTTSPASAKTETPKTTTTKSASSAPPKSSPAKTPTTDKTTTATAKPATKPLKSDKAADLKIAKADKPAKGTKSTTTSTSTSTKPTTTTELTPVQQTLKQNTNLAAKVSSRLPEGTDLMKAAEGFKNLGQFVAAANVSHNLQISFTELKAKMMSGMSLGQAIQAVRPLTASPTVEAQRAEYDARGMIAESDHSTTAASSTVPSATPTSTTAKPKVKTKNSAQ